MQALMTSKAGRPNHIPTTSHITLHSPQNVFDVEKGVAQDRTELGPIYQLFQAVGHLLLSEVPMYRHGPQSSEGFTLAHHPR
jgi:hypothetical protein